MTPSVSLQTRLIDSDPDRSIWCDFWTSVNFKKTASDVLHSSAFILMYSLEDVRVAGLVATCL